MIKCEIDGKEFKNGGVLARYLKKRYGISYREYYHKYLTKSDDVPVCKCGCGQKVKWTNTGYKDYIGKHWVSYKNRTQNSWGHNPVAIRKSAETRCKQYETGERKIWHAGLDKTDGRKSKMISRLVDLSRTSDERSRRSERMKEMRKDGTIPTQRGPAHSQWKGGVSTINQLARSYTPLYDLWKYPILVRDGFKCTQCPNTTNLHVHHSKETFSNILKKVVTLDDLENQHDVQRKHLVCEKITKYHVENKVEGVTLCEECHKTLHPSLNF